jgi:hypothetical protein
VPVHPLIVPVHPLIVGDVPAAGSPPPTHDPAAPIQAFLASASTATPNTTGAPDHVPLPDAVPPMSVKVVLVEAMPNPLEPVPPG